MLCIDDSILFAAQLSRLSVAKEAKRASGAWGTPWAWRRGMGIEPIACSLPIQRQYTITGAVGPREERGPAAP